MKKKSAAGNGDAAKKTQVCVEKTTQRDERGRLLPGHGGLPGAGLGRQNTRPAIAARWFDEVVPGTVEGYNRGHRILQEIYARAMGDPELRRTLQAERVALAARDDNDARRRKAEIDREMKQAEGDNKLLCWLGDRIVAPLKAREIDEDEQAAGGALVLVRDSKTQHYRVQGPDIQAVVGEPPWRTTTEAKGEGDDEGTD